MKLIPSDIEIAQSAKLKPIADIARGLGILDEELESYGRYIAKVDLSLLERLKDRPNGKLIAVTAITPTPLGEGKTVVAFGLGQALAKIGKKVCNTFREPSKGPTFGIKGGGCGGGFSQAVPMENINLHFTGDIYAVETAHNLCAAAIDASIFHGNKLNINPLDVSWQRCVDINDRVLRGVIVGLGGRGNGYPRQTGYDITAATETMTVLALTTSLKDLRERISRMVIGFTYDNKPVTTEDIKVAGAMTALMIEATKPNLVQLLENTSAFCHAGPFANVAHGNNSVLANMMALKLADYVVTESGFGAENGFVKLCDITCHQSGMKLDGAVIVASIRALKMHGGAFTLRPGQVYSTVKQAAEAENMPALERGCENLAKNIQIVKTYDIPVVVAINRFSSDTDAEVELVLGKALEAGADAAVPAECWAKGGDGAIELAEAVVKAVDKPHQMKFLYPDDISIKEKIEIIATRIFGADGVDYQPLAERKIKLYTELGFDKLGINIAKTQLSLSDNPELKNVPKGWRLAVRDVYAAVGAGFLYPLCGRFYTMPGLPSHPAFVDVDVDLRTGKIVGLF